ncbi:unnamed protein product, partial [Polarella glacialis]
PVAPYKELQSRYYRAPEVILGQEYSSQIDVWSAGLTIFEMATDCTLFSGETNNDMIHEMLKVCGAFPKSLAVSGTFSPKHFRARDAAFLLHAKGEGEPPQVMPLAGFDPPSRPLPFLLDERLSSRPPQGVAPERHQGLVRLLAELLGSCLLVNPAKRCTPDTALAHHFFQKGAAA